MKKNISEARLAEIINEVLEESIFGDFYRGFKIDDKEPTTYQEVFSRCGYEIKKEQRENNGLLVYATKKTGAFGAFNGDEPEDVVSALRRVGVRAKALKPSENAQYIFPFYLMGV